MLGRSCVSAAQDRGHDDDPRRQKLADICGYLVRHWRPSHLYGLILDMLETMAVWVAWSEDREREEREERSRTG